MRIAVTDRNERIKPEAPASLDDFCDAIDGYKPINELITFVGFYRFIVIQRENPFQILLKNKPFCPDGVCEDLDPAMIEITLAIEHDPGDSFFLGLIGKKFADHL